jgi:hypothetical protein
MGRACSTCGRDEKCRILVGKSEGERPFAGNLGIYVRMTLMDLREIGGYEVADWIHLAQDRNQRRALVNTEINLWFL